jgi:hypothetical protein
MTLTQFDSDVGGLASEVTDVGVTQRPAMIEVHEYLRGGRTR